MEIKLNYEIEFCFDVIFRRLKLIEDKTGAVVSERKCWPAAPSYKNGSSQEKVAERHGHESIGRDNG